MTDTTYHVFARTGRNYESIFYPTIREAAAAMEVLDRIGAVGIQAMGYDSDHIFCRADVVSSGAVKVEFFSTPIPISATLLDVQACQDIDTVRYITSSITPAHGKLAAAGVTTRWGAEVALHVAHVVADTTGRRPEDVLTTLADVAARGALQAADLEGIDGEGFDTLQALADYMEGTRSYAHRQVAEGNVSYDTLMDALYDVTVTP